MKPKPRDTLRPRLLQSPAAAAAAASVTAAYAVLSANDEKSIDINTVDDSDIKGVQPNGAQEFAIEVDELTAEKNNLESRLTEVREENSRLKTNLDAVNNSYSELGKVMLAFCERRKPCFTKSHAYNLFYPYYSCQRSFNQCKVNWKPKAQDVSNWRL